VQFSGGSNLRVTAAVAIDKPHDVLGAARCLPVEGLFACHGSSAGKAKTG
jgi:hypothetical protein